MDASIIIAKTLVGKALLQSRDRDRHVATLLGPQKLALGLLSSQLADLVARPFAIESEAVDLSWGGLVCIVHARSAHVDAFRIARDARLVTALLELDDAAIAFIDSGKIAAIEVGRFEDQPAEVYLFAEATLAELTARCSAQVIRPRS